MGIAELADRGPVAVGRRDHAAGADHGLADERGDVARRVLEQLGDGLDGVPRHVLDLADELAVAGQVGRDPARLVPYAFMPW